MFYDNIKNIWIAIGNMYGIILDCGIYIHESMKQRNNSELVRRMQLKCSNYIHVQVVTDL